jgi:hypothetical protein
MNKHTNTILILTGCLWLMACEKEDEGMDEMKEKAKIVYINATPNAATTAAGASREIAIYPFYNGTQFNNFPIKFPFTNGYKAFEPGTITIRLDSAQSQGNNPPGTAAKLMEFPVSVEADSYYSLFTAGTNQALDTFFVKDDVSFPTAGKAKIMFLNLSADAGSIDIVNNVTGQVIAGNVIYKQRRGYVEVEPGNLKYRINVAGTSTVLTPSRDLIIDANSVYTVWARGLKVIPVPGSTLANHSLQLSYHANRWTY